MLIIAFPAAVAGLAALAVYGGRPRSQRWLSWLTGVAGAVSLAVTITQPAGHRGPGPGLLGTGEALALSAILVPTVRFAAVPGVVAAAVSAHLAVSVWPLRAASPRLGGTAIGGCLFWSLAAGGAVAGGVYLRMLDTRRIRSVADGRRAQRLDLARDLHDFVAHDVSEMVAQAQAGRYLGERDPAVALAALERVELAGLRALAAMDRTVTMLHTDDEAAVPRDAPGIGDLPGLVAAFGESSGGQARLDLDPALAGGVSRETSTTVYRVVVEALTNVRRHAADTDVVVTLRSEQAALAVSVANSAPTGTQRRVGRLGRRGGLGLPGLEERVEALGGRFAAGPHDDGSGWTVHAVLPLPRKATA